MRLAPYFLSTFILFFGLYEVMHAATIGTQLPGAARPEQVSRALTRSPTAPTPVSPDVVEPKKDTLSALSPEIQKIKFKLNGIILEGNTVYSQQQLRTLYATKLNRIITIGELFEILKDITNYYRNNGYVLAQAILPPQRVGQGVVHIKIIEGTIGQVIVSGCPYHAKCLVQAFGNRIKACPPVNITRMEKYLLLANEIPATSVKSVLSPAKKTKGAADLTLVTTHRPLTGYLSYDNYGTRYIGPQQITGNVGFNSMLQSGDSTQITVTKTPKGRQLTYTDINYNMPLNDEGLRWVIGGTRTITHPEFVLKPLEIAGRYYNYYTALQQPLIRARDQSLSIQLAFNHLDNKVTLLDELLYIDNISSLDFGGNYSFADRFKGVNSITANIRQGLPILGYTTDTHRATALTSRPGGRAQYTKATTQLSRIQNLVNAFSLFGTIRGQWGFNPLLSSEQFVFGGSQLGRGYDVAEIIGDRGLAGSVELRYDWALQKYFLQTLQLYAFYDAGMIWNIITTSGIPKKDSATSAGFGTRIYMTRTISGNLMFTQPLTKKVAAEEILGNGKKYRLFFSVMATLD